MNLFSTTPDETGDFLNDFQIQLGKLEEFNTNMTVLFTDNNTNMTISNSIKDINTL